MLSRRTRILNIFRRIFTLPVFERILLRRTIGSDVNSFWVRATPPNYLYPKESFRDVRRNGVRYFLDISDYMEHAVYFGFRDSAQDRLFDLVKDKKVIIDVGTNLGVTALNFARLNPHAEVIGLEPDKKNFDKVLRNIALNGFSNIRMLNCGAGAEKSTARLYKVDDGNEGMNRILPNGDGQFEAVPITPLDDLDIPADFIKIDVEGYEMEVLKGARHLLATYHPTLFVELDDANLKAQGSSPADVLDYLNSFGYQCYRADTHEVVEDTKGCHFDIISMVRQGSQIAA